MKYGYFFPCGVACLVTAALTAAATGEIVPVRAEGISQGTAPADEFI